MIATAIAKAIRLSLLYFIAVFLAGALFGSLRVIFIQPYLGMRYAELFEMPIMLIWVWQAAHLTVWQLEGGRNKNMASTTLILVGLFGLLFLIIAELTGTAIQRRNWSSVFEVYFAGRDVVAGPVYGLAIVAYAVMPWYIWTFRVQDENLAIGEVNVDEGDYYCER
jgi:uncharacterized membrane protein